MIDELQRDKLWKIYEKLPEELQDLVFSAETADDIDSACGRNNVPEERISDVAKLTGRVLMGLLPPDEFEGALKKDGKLKPEAARNVAREINRFVFFPVKEVLAQLYGMEVTPVAKPMEAKVGEEAVPGETGMPETEEGSEEKPEQKDVYREELE